MEAVRARFLAADAIAATGRWRQRATGPDGKPVEVVVRTTEVLVRGAEGWRYVSDHASVGLPAAAPEAEPKR
jgi:ketosteroid isomerase-like protein